MNRILCILLLFYIIFACQGEQTGERLDREKFVQIYADYMDIALADTAKSNRKEAYLQHALMKHHTTRDEFEKYFAKLRQNPKEMESLLNNMLRELRSMERE